MKLRSVIRSLVSLPIWFLNGADQSSSESSCSKHPLTVFVNQRESLFGRDRFMYSAETTCTG